MGSNKEARKKDPAGRTDLWKPYFSQLVVVPNLNVRTDYGDLSDLETIETLGVLQPFIGWKKDGKYYITDGHRRYAKLEQLFKKDKKDRQVPFMSEPPGLTDKKRVINMIALGTGKPLNPLEQANGVLRCKEEFGMSEAEIARELKFTPAYINRLAEFSRAIPEIKEAVADGTISATTAVDLIIDNQQEKFIKDLHAGVYEKPTPTDLFKGDSAAQPKKAATPGKSARIKASDIKRVNAKGTGEVKEEAINSWAITKTYHKNYEGSPSDPAAAKIFLFLGKIINNKITEADLKKMFKK